jgi:nucleotidyltransferase substrate binding protein (TIGR01987 family)
MNSDIRWKQRFTNFENALKVLERTANIQEQGEIERAALIQFFEMSFELAWKTLKNYLESKEFRVKSPRETILTAVQIQVISVENWLEALDDRNLSSHVYDDEEMKVIAENIREKYLPMMISLQQFLNERLKDE